MDLTDYINEPGSAPKGQGSDDRVEARPGRHDFIVVKAEYKLAESNGLPMWKVQLRLLDKDGETPYKDVFTYMALPHPKRKELAAAAGKKNNPNEFLRDQIRGFLKSIDWDTRKPEEGGRGVPKNETAVLALMGNQGQVEFKMGKPSTGADGTAYEAKLEPQFKAEWDRAEYNASPEAAAYEGGADVKDDEEVPF